MTTRIFAGQRISGNAVFESQTKATVAHEATLGQAWALVATAAHDSILGSRWLLLATVEDLLQPGQSWYQNATQPVDATHNQRWFQEHTVIHQTRMNQRWGLFLRTISEATFNQRYSLNAAQAIDADLNQRWGLVIPAAEIATLDQRHALLAFEAHQATLNQRYRLDVTVVWTPVITAVHYTLILTGAADSLPDLVLPMSSFQGRLRSGSPSYLSVVIPAAAQYSDAIDARPNGQLVVSRGDRWTDGLIQVTEIARVNLETIRLDQGARSYSATLSGHRQTTNSAPKAVALAGAQVRSVASGLRRYRCALDNSLRAGDTAEINGESFTAREISYTVGPNLAVMEVVE